MDASSRVEEQVITECDIPSRSMLDRGLIEAAYFWDSYRAPLKRPDAGIVEIFVGLFAHHPMWMKVALIVRNRIARWCGLQAATASEILNFQVKRNYAVGDKIGVWPIFALTENELVAGRDNKHLDFRLSVLREMKGEAATVVVSTICVVHNVWGKIYLFFVVPFHKWGMRQLMSRAIIAGRL